jgi:hypothetical protein
MKQLKINQGLYAPFKLGMERQFAQKVPIKSEFKLKPASFIFVFKRLEDFHV